MEEELDSSTFIRTRHPNEKLPRDIHDQNLDFLFQTLSCEIVKVNGLYEGIVILLSSPPTVQLAPAANVRGASICTSPSFLTLVIGNPSFLYL